MNHIQVDVVIVTYNSSSTIRACLRSLSIIEANYKIIIVDNGSTDETLEIVATEAPTANVLAGHGNIGFGAAINLGVKSGAGDIVMVLNPDAYLEQGINAVIDVASQHAAVTTGHMRGEDGSLRPNVFRFPRLASVLRVAKASVRPETIAIRMSQSNSRVLAVDYIEGSLMVLKRTLWGDIGGFSPSYFMYGEDRDLSYKARKLGYRTLVVDEQAFTHVGGFNPKRQNWYAVGILVYFMENRRALAPIVYALLVLKFLVKGLLASVRSDRNEAVASYSALRAVAKRPFRPELRLP